MILFQMMIDIATHPLFWLFIFNISFLAFFNKYIKTSIDKINARHYNKCSGVFNRLSDVKQELKYVNTHHSK